MEPEEQSDAGPEHVLTYAPTRSGKGVGLVIPTLLSWNHSTVVADLKGELWALTAGWRKQHAGQTVMRFEPASSRGSVRWNPLDEIRLGTDYLRFLDPAYDSTPHLRARARERLPCPGRMDGGQTNETCGSDLEENQNRGVRDRKSVV